jgi:hypothetical protein
MAGSMGARRGGLKRQSTTSSRRRAMSCPDAV